MDQYRHEKKAVTVSPSATTEVLIYQDCDGTTVEPSPNSGGRYSWVTLGMRLDQDVTLIHRWGPTKMTADADLVIINGTTGTGETMDHTLAYEARNIKFLPGRNKISVKTSGTPPTVNGKSNVVAYELNSYPGLIQ